MKSPSGCSEGPGGCERARAQRVRRLLFTRASAVLCAAQRARIRVVAASTGFKRHTSVLQYASRADQLSFRRHSTAEELAVACATVFGSLLHATAYLARGCIALLHRLQLGSLPH